MTRDKARFERLARAELPGLHALARRLCRDQAEDLVQECLLRAFRAFGSLRDQDAGGGWLRAILTNVWRDRVRSDQRSPRETPIGDMEDFSLYRTLIDEDRHRRRRALPAVRRRRPGPDAPHDPRRAAARRVLGRDRPRPQARLTSPRSFYCVPQCLPPRPRPPG
ncbi:MAG: hypothetical protein HOY78_12305 [Saccharothrix sp.]|nr:hypothetical protein [Saccharothrix sp.]